MIELFLVNGSDLLFVLVDKEVIDTMDNYYYNTGIAYNLIGQNLNQDWDIEEYTTMHQTIFERYCEENNLDFSSYRYKYISVPTYFTSVFIRSVKKQIIAIKKAYTSIKEEEYLTENNLDKVLTFTKIEV